MVLTDSILGNYEPADVQESFLLKASNLVSQWLTEVVVQHATASRGKTEVVSE